ncbi:hypothetical protein [Glutamicibacter ardleyensis]|uniref:Uncharacterized protein n=1 Tax=Glutamicibacter ardleyensis TaxID=225894 RepID=A0ABQ2DIN3_9MICC|nr:hypothetical protein [Glutamicibacter ardleyensis]GGJ58602.1 hypothetical protein GCM10007173_16670 [Glutamicibacter ardleyensis]
MKAIDKLKAKAAEQTTEQLFACMLLLDQQMEGFGTPEQRMVYASMADTIEERHGLNEAMETIFMDINYSGTYREALEVAYCTVVAE